MDEALGLGVIFGGVKVFKRFLPGKLRIALGVAAAGVGLVTVMGQTIFAPAPLLADFDMTAADLTVQAACISNYVSKDFEFNSGQSPEIGCACTAKFATSVINADEYEVYGQAHGLMLKRWNAEYSAKTTADMNKIDAAFNDEYRASAAKAGLDESRFSEIMEITYSVDSICDEMSTYRAKNMTQIAKMRPMGYQPPAQDAAPEPEDNLDVTVAVHNDANLKTARLRVDKREAY